jgi:hypothetical protein
MLIEHIITETYVNAVGSDTKATAIKQKYSQQVWDILQSSYANIGGIKGNGFGTKDDMLKIPMWKMGIRDGKVYAVIMYKDKGGRKSVAAGTDQSIEGGWFIKDIMANELGRSFGEKSKGALGTIMKLYPLEVIKQFLSSPDRVKEMFPNDGIVAITEVDEQEWPIDAKLTLNKYPLLIDYGYLREMNGDMLFKVMLGTSGRPII